MKKLKIFNAGTGHKEPLEKMLKIMTDDWVDNGGECGQTVIDVRDALKDLLDWKQRVETAANEVIDEYSVLTLGRLEKELNE